MTEVGRERRHRKKRDEGRQITNSPYRLEIIASWNGEGLMVNTGRCYVLVGRESVTESLEKEFRGRVYRPRGMNRFQEAR